MAIILVILVKIHGEVSFSYVDAFLNLFGLQGVLASDFGGVYWSIAYEIWFYVLIGSILCLGASRCVKVTGMILFLACGMVFIKLSVVWFFTLLLGTLLYFVKERINLNKWQILASVLALLILQGIIILGSESHAFELPLNGLVNLSMLRWCNGFFIGLVIVSLCDKQPMGKCSAMIEKIGNEWAPMTYCLYITHFTILEFYKQVFGQFSNVNLYSIVVYFVVCGVCIAVGKCFYTYIERPTAKWLKQKFLN